MWDSSTSQIDIDMLGDRVTDILVLIEKEFIDFLFNCKLNFFHLVNGSWMATAEESLW